MEVHAIPSSRRRESEMDFSPSLALEGRNVERTSTMIKVTYNKPTFATTPNTSEARLAYNYLPRAEVEYFRPPSPLPDEADRLPPANASDSSCYIITCRKTQFRTPNLAICDVNNGMSANKENVERPKQVVNDGDLDIPATGVEKERVKKRQSRRRTNDPVAKLPLPNMLEIAEAVKGRRRPCSQPPPTSPSLPEVTLKRRKPVRRPSLVLATTADLSDTDSYVPAGAKSGGKNETTTPRRSLRKKGSQLYLEFESSDEVQSNNSKEATESRSTSLWRTLLTKELEGDTDSNPNSERLSTSLSADLSGRESKRKRKRGVEAEEPTVSSSEAPTELLLPHSISEPLRYQMVSAEAPIARKRGRPSKLRVLPDRFQPCSPVPDEPRSQPGSPISDETKKRGRPRKHQNSIRLEEKKPLKSGRKRGRPRKYSPTGFTGVKQIDAASGKIGRPSRYEKKKAIVLKVAPIAIREPKVAPLIIHKPKVSPIIIRKVSMRTRKSAKANNVSMQQLPCDDDSVEDPLIAQMAELENEGRQLSADRYWTQPIVVPIADLASISPPLPAEVSHPEPSASPSLRLESVAATSPSPTEIDRPELRPEPPAEDHQPRTAALPMSDLLEELAPVGDGFLGFDAFDMNAAAFNPTGSSSRRASVTNEDGSFDIPFVAPPLISDSVAVLQTLPILRPLKKRKPRMAPLIGSPERELSCELNSSAIVPIILEGSEPQTVVETEHEAPIQKTRSVGLSRKVKGSSQARDQLGADKLESNKVSFDEIFDDSMMVVITEEVVIDEAPLEDSTCQKLQEDIADNATPSDDLASQQLEQVIASSGEVPVPMVPPIALETVCKENQQENKHLKKRKRERERRSREKPEAPSSDRSEPLQVNNGGIRPNAADKRECFVTLHKLSESEWSRKPEKESKERRDSKYEITTPTEEKKDVKKAPENKEPEKKVHENKEQPKPPAHPEKVKTHRHSHSSTHPRKHLKRKEEPASPSLKKKGNEKTADVDRLKRGKSVESSAAASPDAAVAAAASARGRSSPARVIVQANRPKSIDEKPRTHELPSVPSVVRPKTPKLEIAHQVPLGPKGKSLPTPPLTPQPPKDSKGVVRIVQCVDMFSGLAKPQVRKEKKDAKPVKRPQVIPSIFGPDSPAVVPVAVHRKLGVRPRPSAAAKGGGAARDTGLGPQLPPGWSRLVHTRCSGATEGKRSVVLISPSGKKFDRKSDLEKYLNKIGLPFDTHKFSFSVNLHKFSSDKSVKFKSRTSLSASKKLTKAKTKKQLRATLKTKRKSGTVKAGEASAVVQLPGGWSRVTRRRVAGGSAGRSDTCYYTPEGRRLRSKPEIAKYLQDNRSSLTLEEIFTEDGSSDSTSASQDRPASPKLPASPAKLVSTALAAPSSSHQSGLELHSKIMYDDPRLPAGWKRKIHVRETGNSSGRVEVYIVSPEGRKLSSRTKLKRYLQLRNLLYNVEDFDFTRSGRAKEPPQTPTKKESFQLTKAPHKLTTKPNTSSGIKKRGTPKTLLALELKRKSVSAEDEFENGVENKLAGEELLDFYRRVSTAEFKQDESPAPAFKSTSLIDDVRALLIASGVSTSRAERRLSTQYPDAVRGVRRFDASDEVPGVPSAWVQALLSCRPELPSLNEAAVQSVAAATEYFIQRLASHAHRLGGEDGLQYQHVANLVADTPSLAPLRSLIPQRVTVRNFRRITRPSRFFSFTG